MGRHHTNEAKLKISEATSGKNNPMYGKSSWAGLTEDEMSLRKNKLRTTLKGRHWWNNGLEEIPSKECPGEEWVKGRLKRNDVNV